MNCLPLVAVATLALSVPLWFRLSLSPRQSRQKRQNRNDPSNATRPQLHSNHAPEHLVCFRPPPLALSPPLYSAASLSTVPSLRDRDNLKNRTREQVVFYTARPHDSSQTSTRTSISNIPSISDMIRSMIRSSIALRNGNYVLWIDQRKRMIWKNKSTYVCLIKRIRLNECEEMRVVLVYQVKRDQTNTWK